MNPPVAFRIPLLLALGVALAAGCDEQGPLGAPSGASASGQPVLSQGRPATPAPAIIATPAHASSAPVATPVPRGVEAVTPTPAPIAPTASPAGSPSPGASPTAGPTASPTPQPSPSGPHTPTGVPGDLAVSGPAYFVLSTKPYPTGLEDLLFTREGPFRLRAETAGSVPVLRLRDAEHGFLVVGYQLAGEPAAPPLETLAEDYAVLATSWAGQNVAGQGLTLDAASNPQALTQLSFDFTGKLAVANAAPRMADGSAGSAYVALAQFDSPEHLVPALGFPGIFRYETSALEPDEEAPAPGMIRLGIAVSGTGRTVGNANLILTGMLER